MRNAAAKSADFRRADEARALEAEILSVHEILQGCFEEIEQVLSRSVFDAGALTSARLKLAGIRLTRGPLIGRIWEALAGHLTEGEAAMFEELRASHQRLLQIATTHTSKWTLSAIEEDWPQYRRETRELIRRWIAKAEREQRLLLPMVQRCTRLT